MSSSMRRNAPKGLIKSGFGSRMGDEFLSDTWWSLVKSMSRRINMVPRAQLIARSNYRDA